jgi:hypothetical protein
MAANPKVASRSNSSSTNQQQHAIKNPPIIQEAYSKNINLLIRFAWLIDYYSYGFS